MRALLVALLGEVNEAVTARHSAHRIGHDFCQFAGQETVLEQQNKAPYRSYD